MLEEIRNTEFSIWECCITAQSFQSSLKYLQYITPVSIHLQCRKSLLHQSYHFQSCSNWFIHPEKPGKQTHKLPAIQLAELFFIRSLNELVEPLVRGMTARPMKQEKKPHYIHISHGGCMYSRHTPSGLLQPIPSQAGSKGISKTQYIRKNH